MKTNLTADWQTGRDGQGLTEYLILLVLISLVSIAAVKSLGSTIQRKIQMAREHINQVSASRD